MKCMAEIENRFQYGRFRGELSNLDSQRDGLSEQGRNYPSRLTRR